MLVLVLLVLLILILLLLLCPLCPSNTHGRCPFYIRPDVFLIPAIDSILVRLLCRKFYSRPFHLVFSSIRIGIGSILFRAPLLLLLLLLLLLATSG